jgi:hypothetical protein
VIVFSLKLILHFNEFNKTSGASLISFSVKVSNSHLVAVLNSQVISSASLFISFHKLKSLCFQLLITTISLSSNVKNS